MDKRNILLLILLIVNIVIKAQMTKTIYVQKPGTLSVLLTEDEKTSITELIISGKLNSQDVILLRRMAGAEDNLSRFAWKGHLETLDIKDAKFINDKNPFLKVAAKKNFKITVNKKYKVYTRNSKTGESRVMSREEYLDRLNDNNNRNSKKMLEANSVGKRTNRIEELKEGKNTYILGEITDTEWTDIKQSGKNEWIDHYVDRDNSDSVFYIYYHTAKDVISSAMFKQCKNLKKILLHSDIQGIGSMAFQGCIALKEITIPKKVDYLAQTAFRMTPSLKQVFISNKSEFKFFTLENSMIIERFFKTSNPDIIIKRY